jgi:hypothetical protein
MVDAQADGAINSAHNVAKTALFILFASRPRM